MNKYKKYYKFIFLFIFGIFFFMPKDVFAASNRITLYDSNYGVIADCYDCSALSNENTTKASIIRITKIATLYKNLQYNYSWSIDVDYGGISTPPATSVVLYSNGQQSLNDGYTWKYTGTSTSSIGVIRSYTFSGNWTQSSNSSDVFVEVYLGTATYVGSVVVYSPTVSNIGDSTADVVAGVGQQIIDNNNDNTDKIIANENKNHEEAETTRKGIWETIKDLPNQFLTMLKSLFIPDDDYFSTKFEELTDNVTDILGFLAYPFTLVVNTFEFFLTVEDTGSYVFSWDNIGVPNFEDHVLIQAGSYDLGQLLENSKIASLRNIGFVFINALLLLAFLQLCHNKYSQIFGGDVSTTEFISVAEEYDIDYKTGEVSNIKHIEKKTTRRDVS